MSLARMMIVLSAAGIVYAAAPLLGSPNMAGSGVCCGSVTDCAAQELCCPPETIGQPACDSALQGYCRERCFVSRAS